MTEYTVTETETGWVVCADGDLLGRRPKKEPAKRLAQQHAGRRKLDWVWDPEARLYVSA
jgi:hypothetical protein